MFKSMKYIRKRGVSAILIPLFLYSSVSVNLLFGIHIKDLKGYQLSQGCVRDSSRYTSR